MIRKYLYIALAAFSLTSCSEGLMDDINKDNSDPASGTVDAKLQVPGFILNTGFNVISGNYAWYISSYTEQEFGDGNNQLYLVETRNTGETASSATFNNEWNSAYLNLRGIQEAIDKCSKGGLNEGQDDVKGMAEVMKAINIGILTDLHGDIPYSEALQGSDKLNPKIDKQADIYTAIFSILDDAITDFKTAISNNEQNVGSSDILFANDNAQWLGLAYALKARYKLHLLYRQPDVLSEVIDDANAAISAGFAGANLSVFDANNNNPWTAYFYSRQYTGSSKTVCKLFEERSDPRESVYDVDIFGSGYGAGTPGNAEEAASTGVVDAPAWLDNPAASIHIFSKSELYFILAEAEARSGKDFKQDLGTAVATSFDDFKASDPGYVKSFSASSADAYIATLPLTLKEVMIQKYLSQVRDEQIEAYNDIRRCKALGEEFITLTNPSNTSSIGNVWPLRLPYGESDVRSNPNVRTAFGSGNDAGKYVFTENVWWAGGSR